jgi:hypothetical protein
VRLLVTSSRMPFALALIRRLADAGHTVYASDTYLVSCRLAVDKTVSKE